MPRFDEAGALATHHGVNINTHYLCELSRLVIYFIRPIYSKIVFVDS